MSEPTLETLLEQVSRLERDNRRMKQIGCLLLLLFAVVFMLGQAQPVKVPKVVEAEAFVLRDATGARRGSLEISDQGAAYLSLNDSDGDPRAQLTVDRAGDARLSLWSVYRKLGVSVKLTPAGQRGVIGLFDGEEGTLIWQAP